MKKYLWTVVLVLITGCATVSVSPSLSVTGTENVKAEMAFPLKGAEWVMRTDGTNMVTYVSLGDGNYHGRAVYQVSDGVGVSMIDKSTRNFIAYVVDGKERTSIAPHSGEFEWPLSVGKSWTARFAYEDHVARRVWNSIVVYWKVEAYEDVKVPAGTFKAFRLQSTPGQNSGSIVTLWYVPELGFVVKRVNERTSTNYLGAGTATSELMEYRAP